MERCPFCKKLFKYPTSTTSSTEMACPYCGEIIRGYLKDADTDE